MRHIEKLVVYGMGKVGRSFVNRCLLCGIEKKKLQLTDSDSGLWGEIYKGIEIQSPDSILMHEADTVVISVSDKYKQEVVQRLKDRYHITDEKIIYGTNILANNGGGI